MASTSIELRLLPYFMTLALNCLLEATSLFCDNLSALHLIVNLVFYAHTKHIQLDYLKWLLQGH